MVWLYVGTLTKVLVREKDICLCLQNKARMTNQIFGKTRLCVDLISSNFIMQTVGQVARWSIAAAQVLGWQPFLGTTKVPHGMIPDSAISVKSLAHKYIIWRSPRGILNNRIYWINGLVLRVGKRVGKPGHYLAHLGTMFRAISCSVHEPRIWVMSSNVKWGVGTTRQDCSEHPCCLSTKPEILLVHYTEAIVHMFSESCCFSSCEPIKPTQP